MSLLVPCAVGLGHPRKGFIPSKDNNNKTIGLIHLIPFFFLRRVWPCSGRNSGTKKKKKEKKNISNKPTKKKKKGCPAPACQRNSGLVAVVQDIIAQLYGKKNSKILWRPYGYMICRMRLCELYVAAALAHYCSDPPQDGRSVI
jgi:hypothetical protein